MISTSSDAIVYIVDDEFSIRDSLQLLLESSNFKVKSFESAIDFLESYDPNQAGCLILDVLMPAMNGIELQDVLVKKGIKMPIIFISGHGDVTTSSKAFRAGAVDFFEKPFDNQTLLNRIDEALKNELESWEKNKIKRELLERLNNLTPREQEVFKLITNSYSNKEAAKILGISHRTIDVHRAHIMEKMQAENLSDLIVMAMTCEQL
ncbi:MAG: response regulator transcription factor [Gammaproteobacteria bacterium]